MTTFLRLLTDKDKASHLLTSCTALRNNTADPCIFHCDPRSFCEVPGAPFAYWVNEALRGLFKTFPRLESGGREARQGLATADDFRFVKAWWEIKQTEMNWLGFAKGGSYSKYYSDIHLQINWKKDGAEIRNFVDIKTGKLKSRPQNTEYFERPGLTWPLRTQGGLSLRAMPQGCVFGHKGPAAFVVGDDSEELLALLALMNSEAFRLLVSLLMSFGAYEVGVLQKTPVLDVGRLQQAPLAELARRAWSLKRSLDTLHEASHAFLLPPSLRPSSTYDPSATQSELDEIQVEIDAIAFDLYGFGEADRSVAKGASSEKVDEKSLHDGDAEEDSDDDEATAPIDETSSLLSWAAGVAFGRFDWRLATGEREAPPEPEPFDPIPAKSPGMLPDDAAPFHTHAGILVDDPGHPHDLAHLIEEVLARVDAPAPADVRRWLQREFFPIHLQNYSKSRRKAPIYWPLSTASGAYTLWVYYPSLTSQTLYTAINDFLEGPSGKLKQVEQEAAALHARSGRSRDEDKKLESAENLEAELIDLRDTLLRIAPTFHPSHDDGVQITAAPLWPLFRHKPWQKILKDTWAKLEKGEYDWAHLALNYRPEQVREKCKTDKSLAIAHDLEDLYVESEQKPAKKRGGTR